MMISEALQKEINKLQLILGVLWFAFTLSIVLYVGIIYFICADASSSENLPASFKTMELFFSILAVAVGLVSILLRRFFFSDQRIQKILQRLPVVPGPALLLIHCQIIDVFCLMKYSNTGRIDQCSKKKPCQHQVCYFHAFSL